MTPSDLDAHGLDEPVAYAGRSPACSCPATRTQVDGVVIVPLSHWPSCQLVEEAEPWD